MSRLRMGLALGLALGMLASCAPIAPPTAPKATESEPDKASAELINVLPAPSQVAVKADDGLRTRLEAAIRNVQSRDLLTTNGFWTIFHGILGMGLESPLRDPVSGRRVRAIDHIADGGELRGLRFIPTKHGLDVQIGPVSLGQGHQDQFIAEMGQWGIAPDKRFVVLGKDYTFMDFIRESQMRARVTSTQELSWAIGVLAQYVGTNMNWVNDAGERLHFEDMIRYELNASVEEAACGGTHRLFGLCWAEQIHRARGGALEGAWKIIPSRVARYRDLARQYRNADGSFSTNFFREPGNNPDPQARINTSGHTLEWLALALADEELKESWVQEAAVATANMILNLQTQPIEGGSLYHAVHGLILYYTRMYGEPPPGCSRPYYPPRDFPKS